MMMFNTIVQSLETAQAEWIRERADELGSDLEICPIKGYVQERGTHELLMSGSD